MDFDHIILDISINAVRNLNNKLKDKPHNISNSYFLIENCEKTLVAIREHDSLREKYCDMFNQCVVLLVSYFGESLSDLFETTVTENISKVIDSKLLNEEFKFRLDELIDCNFNLADRVGEVLISKKRN
jgi:Iap family predicted aminopeptidase